MTVLSEEGLQAIEDLMALVKRTLAPQGSSSGTGVAAANGISSQAGSQEALPAKKVAAGGGQNIRGGAQEPSVTVASGKGNKKQAGGNQAAASSL